MNRATILLSALGAVLLVALWWLFLYSPGQDELASVRDEIAAAEVEQAGLEQRIAALEAVRARAPETEAAIAQLRSIVPDDPDLPGALRQIAAAAEDAGVTVDSLSTTRPEVVDELTGLYSSSVVVAASGSYFQLVDLLRRLEAPEITARGLVMQTMSVTPGDYPLLNISLSGQMFSTLAPPPSPDDVAEPAPEPDTTDDADGGGDE